MKFNCAHCGAEADKPSSHVNRSRARGDNIYCSLKCSHLGRRKGKSIEQKKAEKATYDRKYRRNNIEEIKRRKAAYFKRTYDPLKAAEHRKKIMPRHVEYCRRPEYKAWKKQYDRRYRAEKNYGEYADCFLLTQDIRTECLTRSSDYQIRLERGDFSKRKERKNEQQANSKQLKAGSMGNLERGQRGQNGRLTSR